MPLAISSTKRSAKGKSRQASTLTSAFGSVYSIAEINAYIAHRDGCRETAAHVEGEITLGVGNLPLPGLLAYVLIRFDHLPDASRANRMTVADQPASRIDWKLEREFAFH